MSRLDELNRWNSLSWWEKFKERWSRFWEFILLVYLYFILPITALFLFIALSADVP